MTEQDTIERAALAYVNFVRAEKGFPLVTALDGFRPEDRAGYIAHVTAVLAALRPGDVLPGGNIVISRSQFAAIAFAKTQADASGTDQRAVNAVVRDTMGRIAAQPKEGE